MAQNLAGAEGNIHGGHMSRHASSRDHSGSQQRPDKTPCLHFIPRAKTWCSFFLFFFRFLLT